LLFRSLKIGSWWGIDIFLHWTMWLLPFFILCRGLVLYSAEPDETALQTTLVFGVYLCLLVNELAHLAVARWLALGVRDLTLYPIGGIMRLSVIGERPWKEPWVAAAGPLTHLLIAGAIAVAFLAAGLALAPRLNASQPYVETFFNRLFWLNVLLAILQIIPAFPMDGGRIFRGALALSVPRLRATETAALLSSFVALLMLVPGMVWLSSVWWLIPLGIIVHVGGQQELLSVRYYAGLQQPLPGAPPTAPIIMAPIDQLLDDDVRPSEPDFTGLIWNPKNRLWIVWRNGEPVSANALVGE
jgi:Zn-dependent protease